MSKQTSLVVTYDHDTKKFYYDDDSTDVWIRDLFFPPSSTFDDAVEDYVFDDNIRLTVIDKLNKILQGEIL